MNVVYRLVNRSKGSGRRFYIGSKVECHIAVMNGVATMIQRNDKPYFGSSSSFEMIEDMKNGHVFEVEVLEEVPDKSKLIAREMAYIEAADAVNSDEYYNMSTACLDMHNFDRIGNRFGEDLKTIAKNRSSCSKRDKNARRCGFDNFGEMALEVWNRADAGEKISAIAETYGLERHRFAVSLRDFDKDKCREDVKRLELTEQVRAMFLEGATLQYISKYLDIELPAARALLGRFDSKHERAYLTAKNLGMTKDELEIHITRRVLDGEDLVPISKDIGIDLVSAKRYFLKCIRSRLKSSDLQ